MKERGRFLYQDPDGVIFIKFEHPGKGIPIERLLPPSGRGAGFSDFRVKDYFGLANMILTTPDEWEQACMAASPAQITPSAPNLDYLHLRTPDGGMNEDRAAELFTVVAAYWENSTDLALKPGLVAAAWHKGMNAEEIIQFIRDNTQTDPKSGQPKLVFAKGNLDVEVMSSLLPLDIHRDALTDANIDNLMEWISSVPRGHAAFEVPKRMADDIVFLGLVNKTCKIDRVATDAARDYIWRQIDQPDYPALWRHIQTTKGDLAATEPTSDYTHYNLEIAELADSGVDNLALLNAILVLAESGAAVPTKQLYRATRAKWELDQACAQDRSVLKTALTQQSLNLGRWLAFDRATLFTREPQKMLVSGTPRPEIEAFLETQISKAGSAQTLQDFKNHYFKDGFVETLRDLGVVGDRGQWSEVGFVRQQLMMQTAQKKGIPPSLEWLRWGLHRRYRAEQPVPFAWALKRDRLPTKTVQRARMLASMALSGGLTGEKFQIDGIISPEQFQILWKFGAWLSDDATVYLNDQYPDLTWLAKYAQHPRLRLKDWQKICEHIFGKLNQTPQPILLRERLREKGIIVLEWRHDEHRQSASKSFGRGEKVGRNDPCPCGSGKKFKKCCGR